MGTVESWLSSVPDGPMYVILAIVIGMESMGIPVPGEIALVSAALLAVSGHVDIFWVAVAATLGAIIGDSIGYAVGRRGGRSFLERMGRRFPRHLGPPQIASAERTFQRWGVAAIFFGRFIALLRILAGPLAGALRVPYPKFLAANAAGGAVWATGTALLVYYVGKAAETWLSRFSWVALAVAVVGGVVTTLVLRHRAHKRFEAVAGQLAHTRTSGDNADDADAAGVDADPSRSGAVGPPGPTT
ncbi:MAG TPA: DedA family protein [Micromonosporaceae bacterium]|nr:DedA family protein [Micromonosporaceae bacterium]